MSLKDKISQYVNFSFGYGNEATLGFQKIRDTSFPVTLIPRSIDEFVLQKYRIIFVLEKKAEEEKFSRIIMEVKGGLFKELYSDFPDDLKKLINFEK